MRRCISAPGVPMAPGCETGDFNADGSVDCDDWGQFALVWMEPGEPAPSLFCLGIAPAISAWGVVVLVLMILIAGTVVIRRGSAISVYA